MNTLHHGTKSTSNSNLDNAIALTFDMKDEDKRKNLIQERIKDLEANAEALND